VIQEDGTTGAAAAALPPDSRISLGSGRPIFQGVARNLALSRADGDLIKVLDSDDVLPAGALARDIAVFEARPETGWTTSKVVDFLPDGTNAEFAEDPQDGPLNRDDLLRYWREHNGRPSVHPATLCIRRHLLFALGGWMALPAGEDTGLLIAAAVVSPGYFIAETGLLYRKWPGQVTAQPEHSAHDELQARNQIIEERANALAAWRV
jgi:glycosyltransferase involved in cell wall biosynthesis